MIKTFWRTMLGVGILLLFCTTMVQADSTPVTYYACVLNNVGTIRMISSSGKCTTYETEITWNNVGPQGPVGPAGPAGPPGPQGPQGPAGANGISAGYVSVNSTFTLVDVFYPNTIAVVTLSNLPVGNYVVTALANVQGGPDGALCQLSPDPTSIIAKGGGSWGSGTLFVTDGVNITGGSIIVNSFYQKNTTITSKNRQKRQIVVFQKSSAKSPSQE